MNTTLAATELSRLKWRCRRGMLENDILIERFFQQYESQLTRHQADGLQMLMDLADNDLLDLLLSRCEPVGELACPQVAETLALLRVKPHAVVKAALGPRPSSEALASPPGT